VLSLSSATTAGSITLIFIGALNAPKAVEASRYILRQNGVDLDVFSVAYNAMNRGVKLTLENTPAAGSIEVSCDLTDAKGFGLHGKTLINVK
jgi:hypothetical protein